MEFEQANQNLPHSTVKAYFRRKNHLKDLLLIYVTQTSGRLGLTSMLPKVERDYSPMKSPPQLYQERMAEIQRQSQMMRADGQRHPYEPVATQNHHVIQDLVLDFWQQIAKIMEMGNHQMFPNRRQTRDIIKSGRYVELLRFFQTPLRDWRRGFEQSMQSKADILSNRAAMLTFEQYQRNYDISLQLNSNIAACTSILLLFKLLSSVVHITRPCKLICSHPTALRMGRLTQLLRMAVRYRFLHWSSGTATIDITSRKS